MPAGLPRGSVSALHKPPQLPTSGRKQEILWLFSSKEVLDFGFFFNWEKVFLRNFEH